VARGGGPGGFDVNALMKQAQQMQAQMMEAQEKLKEETVEASAGGGMVKVVMAGDQSLRSITIDPEVVDPEDIELLQELVQVAVNEGLTKLAELAEAKMGPVTGGLGGGLGGMLGG
jgi:nucleoid-associated protein EbfC